MSERFVFSSTAIASGEYDADTQTLTVDFVNGNTYTLSGVPEFVWTDFKADPSPGRFWNTRLKGVY